MEKSAPKGALFFGEELLASASSQRNSYKLLIYILTFTLPA